MSVIYFNEDGYKKIIKDDLKKSTENLKKAKDIFLNAPYDFYYYNTVNSIDSFIQDNINAINVIYNRISNDSTEYSKIEEATINTIKGLNNYNLRIRQSAIK